jgi:integrase
LLILTGQRRGEIAGLRWNEINWEQRRIEIPAPRMKMAKSHTLPLTKTTIALLQSLPRPLHDDRVFGPVHFSRAKALLDRRAGIAGWQIHDLRRTARTGMAAVGVDQIAAEQVLAHIQSGIRGVYDRHDYFSAKLQALETWERRLRGIIGVAEAAAG